MMLTNSGYIVFGANGFIGSSFCKYLETNNLDFIAVSKSKTNIYNFKNYFTLDLEVGDPWPEELCEFFYKYRNVVFLSGIAHREKTNVLKVNLSILRNFLNEYRPYKNSHNILFASTRDIKYIDKKPYIDSSEFQIQYAKSKKLSEDILKNSISKNIIILRLPTVYSDSNKIDLQKRYSFKFFKKRIFFKILPSPDYEIISTKELNELFVKKFTKENSSNEDLIVFKTSSQEKLLRSESNLYFPIPSFLIYFLYIFCKYSPFKSLKNKTINFDKILSLTK